MQERKNSSSTISDLIYNEIVLLLFSPLGFFPAIILEESLYKNFNFHLTFMQVIILSWMIFRVVAFIASKYSETCVNQPDNVSTPIHTHALKRTHTQRKPNRSNIISSRHNPHNIHKHRESQLYHISNIVIDSPKLVAERGINESPEIKALPLSYEGKIANLTWEEFEQYIALVFKRNGYEAEVTPPRWDKGKDIIAKKDGYTYFIECKHWERTLVGREFLQKLVGAAAPYNVKNVIFITTSWYHKNALEYQEKLNASKLFNLQLLDMETLKKLDFLDENNRRVIDIFDYLKARN